MIQLLRSFGERAGRTATGRTVLPSLLAPGLGRCSMGYRRKEAILLGIAASGAVMNSIMLLVRLAQSADAGRLAKAAKRAKMESEGAWWN